jgi:hypothetical protein
MARGWGGARPTPPRRRAERRPGGLVGLVFCLLAVPVTAEGAAWPQPEGRGQIVLEEGAALSISYFDEEGTARGLDGIAWKSWLKPSFEYGLTDRLTLLAEPSLVLVEQTRWRFVPISVSRSWALGLGRSELGLRWGLARDGDHDDFEDWSVSVDLSAVHPGLVTQDRFSLVRQDDPGAELRLNYGHFFFLFDEAFFIEMQAGYHLRVGAEPEEISADLTLAHEGSRTDYFVKLLNDFGHGARPPHGNYANHTLEIGFVYWLRADVGVGLAQSVNVSGANTFIEPRSALSLWWRF